MTHSPALARVAIERLGRRGEGVATVDGDRLYVPYSLPGDVVSADREGDRGTLIGLVAASPERIAPICPYFTTCGGCAVQALAAPAYAAWKRGLLVAALAQAGIDTDGVAPLLDAHGRGRRRATFHARVGADGGVRVGFMQARSHAIVPIDVCPILDPGLDGAIPAARALATALAAGPRRADDAKPLDLLCTATDDGLDVDLRGHGPLDDAARAALSAVAIDLGLARLSNHGTIVVESRKPTLAIGTARVVPPPGVFLQATAAGEAALAERVVAALAGAKRVADLFAGIGTFALRLAAHAEITAFDTDPAALAALDRAGRAAPALRAMSVETRDLFRRPLTPADLAAFDAVCLDPPRAGAETQMRALAASEVRKVVSVSCDATSFARDAAILLAAGFAVGEIVPIDQFRHSPHLEIVATFERAASKKKRRLLG